ncbi:MULTISPECIES: YadA-like family protein [Bartonella]|uniref:Autotransporter adhesin n=1 Tax=Bartonella chomelii TaxID=236402 RepID=A0ABR6E439_9HYPH|nr:MULTISPECIES: YadA-like family protein [Bartonella]MBA9083321.1 autotransporter adhesin [Bartonella chomelii]
MIFLSSVFPVFATDQGVKYGSGAKAEKQSDTAIGEKADAKGDGATAVGSSSQALQLNSTAIGRYAKALGHGGTAIGTLATTMVDPSGTTLDTAIGYYAQSLVWGGVALGSNSKADVKGGIAGYNPGKDGASLNTSSAWKSTEGAVSVGDVNSRKTRQIVGVAAGTEDTDVVNVAQLKALREWMEKESGTWKLSVNGKDTIKDTIKVTSKNKIDLAGGNNIKLTKSNNKVTFGLADELQVSSISIEKAGLKIDGNGIDAGNKNITNVAEGKITEESADAVNGAQLYSISNQLATHLGGGAAVREDGFFGPRYILSKVSTDGTVEQADFNDVGSAFIELDANIKNVNNHLKYVSGNFTEAIDKISEKFKHSTLLWNKRDKAFVALHTEGGERKNSKITFLANGDITHNSTDAITGAQLNETNTTIAQYFGGGAGYQGEKWTDPTFTITGFGEQSKNGKQAYNNVAAAFDAVNDSMFGINNRVQRVETWVKSNSLNWDDSQGAYDANHNGRAGKITNVANGAIEKGSTDVITGHQLWETKEKVNKLEDKVDNVSDQVDYLSDRAVTYDKDKHGGKVNSITLVGGKEDEPVLIDNVADGKVEKDSKQAVNGGQLKEQMGVVLADANKYANKKIENMVSAAFTQANAYADMKFEALNYRVEGVQKEARQAAAIGLAIASLHYINTPGTLSIAFGSGVWRGQSALAFGTGYMSEDGTVCSNFSVTTSGGHWGVGAGLSLALK